MTWLKFCWFARQSSELRPHSSHKFNHQKLRVPLFPSPRCNKLLGAVWGLLSGSVQTQLLFPLILRRRHQIPCNMKDHMGWVLSSEWTIHVLRRRQPRKHPIEKHIRVTSRRLPRGVDFNDGPAMTDIKIWFITGCKRVWKWSSGATGELCNRGATWLKNNTAQQHLHLKIFPSLSWVNRLPRCCFNLAPVKKFSRCVYIKQRPVCFITSLRCSLIRMCGGRPAHSHHFVPAIISLAAILFRRRLNQLVA